VQVHSLSPILEAPDNTGAAEFSFSVDGCQGQGKKEKEVENL
jgi:hypothetical protein